MRRTARVQACALVAFGVVVCVVFSCAAAGPQHSEPGQGVERAGAPADPRVLAYLEVLNSGEPGTIQAFLAEHYAPSFLQALPSFVHITIHTGFYYEAAGRGYEFHGMRGPENGALNALVRNRLTGAWMELRLPVADDAAQHINGFPELEPTAPPPGVERRGRLTDAEIVERLEACMAKLAEDDAFSGAVLVARDEHTLFARAYGMASKSYAVANRLDTKFNIASLGKMLTGVAVAQLVEQGKLSFDDPVSSYLPTDWLRPEVSQRVQIRHLLTHTSGLGDYFRRMRQQLDPMVFRGLSDYRPLVADATLAFEPGSRWSYSNTGYLLLGVVIEQVTGQSYFEYLREHVYQPAGMINTDAYEKDRPVPNRATGYMKLYTANGVQWMSNRYSRAMKGGPSGGSFSTVEDLWRFGTALRTHKLLGAECTREVLSAKPELSSPFYGYGFFIARTDAGRVAHHSGDGSGIEACFRMYLDSGYTAAVLSNYNKPAASIVDRVAHQLIACR